MTLLVPPQWLSATHPIGVFGNAALLDPAARVITLRFELQVLAPGGVNGAVFARLYESSTPNSSFAAATWPQTTTFSVFDGQSAEFTFDAALATRPYVMGFFGSNTVGNTNSLYMSMHDDVGTSAIASVMDVAMSPLGLLGRSTSSPVALLNPYAGQGALDLSSSADPVAGMQWQVASAPAGAGLELGWLPDYQTRILQLVAYYRLADGSLVADVIAEPHSGQGLVLFAHGRPDHVDYWVPPGFSVNLWWLI